jgi:hypothetical protein
MSVLCCAYRQISILEKIAWNNRGPPAARGGRAPPGSDGASPYRPNPSLSLNLRNLWFNRPLFWSSAFDHSGIGDVVVECAPLGIKADHDVSDVHG